MPFMPPRAPGEDADWARWLLQIQTPPIRLASTTAIRMVRRGCRWRRGRAGSVPMSELLCGEVSESSYVACRGESFLRNGSIFHGTFHPGSTDPRQRIVFQFVQHAPAAEAGLQGHPAASHLD